MFGQGFDSPQLHQRFEPRLKANQKTGSTAQVPLPFSLARPLPRSPLRSADGHRNCDAIVPRYLHISAFPIGNRYSVADSVRSLQLPSAPPRNGSRFICRLPVFFLRGGAVGSAPLLLAFDKQTGCTLARHDTRVSWRPPTWALAVRQLPSAPPALRATAQMLYTSEKLPLLIVNARYFVVSTKLHSF